MALAEHELERGHPERVLPLLTPVLEKKPDSSAVWLTLARAYETLGEPARAHAHGGGDVPPHGRACPAWCAPPPTSRAGWSATRRRWSGCA